LRLWGIKRQTSQFPSGRPFNDSSQLSITELKSAAFWRTHNQYFRQKDATSTWLWSFQACATTAINLCCITSQALAAREIDVLQLWADYTLPEVSNLSQADQTLRMVSDAQTALQAGVRARKYVRLIMAGKSIGTLTMAFLLSQEFPLEIAATIWLTPLLQIPFVPAAIQKTTAPAIVAGGTADATFDPDNVSSLEKLPNITMLCVEGGNHSLEIPHDLRRSLIALSDLVG
jgi:predicted alpha/beta-hydrolase family hydrolase